MIAAREGYVEALRYYGSQGYKSIASKVIADLKNDHSALHVAAELGNVAVLDILIDLLRKTGRLKENLEKYASITDRPLQMAAANNREDAIKYLLQVGADKDGRSSDYATPMHRAAANGHVEAVKCLIDNGADRDARTTNSLRPVDMAASNKHIEVVRCLLNYGLPTKNLGLFERSIENARNRRVEVLKFLLNYGLTTENLGPFMRSIENASNKRAEAEKCLLDYGLPTKNLGLFMRSIENNDLDGLVWLIKMQIYDFQDMKNLDEKAQSVLFSLAVESGEQMLVNRCLDAGMKPTYALAKQAQINGHFEIATQFIVYLRGQFGILPDGKLELLHPLLFK